MGRRENYAQSGFFFVAQFPRTWSDLFLPMPRFFSIFHVTFLFPTLHATCLCSTVYVAGLCSTVPFQTQFVPVSKRGLIRFTSGTSSQLPPTTPLPLAATMWNIIANSQTLALSTGKLSNGFCDISRALLIILYSLMDLIMKLCRMVNADTDHTDDVGTHKFPSSNVSVVNGIL